MSDAQSEWLIYSKVMVLVEAGKHLYPRTFDYGHNDMQTDNFCKFCEANQGKYLSSHWHSKRNEVLICGEWHRRGCLVIVALRILN